jgi:SAM-dependent methyltransferase
MKLECSEISRRLETWYRRDSGSLLYLALQEHLRPLLDRSFGYHALQLGPLEERDLLECSPINHRIIAGEGAGAATTLQCHGHELPLESDSVDLVLALHALEFCPAPHQTLREMHRVLTPHGHLLIVAFNPLSLLGATQQLASLARRELWRAQRPVSQSRLGDWLRLVGCEVERFHHVSPLPPWGGERLRRNASRLDAWADRRRLPGGSLYIAHAIKQVANLRRPPLSVRRRLIGLTVPKPVASPGGVPRQPRHDGGDLAA